VTARRLNAVLLAAGLCATGTGCSDNDDDSADRRLLELRPVVSSTEGPCAEAILDRDRNDGEVRLPVAADGRDECLHLARAIVDAKDVRSATVGETPSKQPALSVVLGAAGSADLDGFAERNMGKRLAIVADGDVVSAPAVRSTSFAGRIQVTGLSKEKTDELFRRLDKLINR